MQTNSPARAQWRRNEGKMQYLIALNMACVFEETFLLNENKNKCFFPWFLAIYQQVCLIDLTDKIEVINVLGKENWEELLGSLF
jgi:hypothetical protein